MGVAIYIAYQTSPISTSTTSSLCQQDNHYLTTHFADTFLPQYYIIVNATAARDNNEIITVNDIGSFYQVASTSYSNNVNIYFSTDLKFGYPIPYSTSAFFFTTDNTFYYLPC